MMFDSNIKLWDWEVDVQGINEVIKANLNIFNSVDSIRVKPILIVEKDNFIFAEIEIIVNDNDILEVVDIIKFNSDSKIIGIRAFKG